MIGGVFLLPLVLRRVKMGLSPLNNLSAFSWVDYELSEELS